jgi:hypothetical protein
MKRLTSISFAVLGCLLYTNPAPAQVTNLWPVAPATRLEAFNTNIGLVILKATTELGVVSGNNGAVSVRSREAMIASTGRSVQGIAIVITLRGQLNDTLLLDYEEIAPLLDAIDYFGKLDISDTSFNTLDAEYTTKSGFHIAAIRTRQSGGIQCSVRDLRTGEAPVVLSWQQMAQFSGLIIRAKATLDAAHGK